MKIIVVVLFILFMPYATLSTAESLDNLSELEVMLLFRERVAKPCSEIARPQFGTHAIEARKIIQQTFIQSVRDSTIKQFQKVPFYQRDVVLKEMMERCVVYAIRMGLDKKFPYAR